MPRLSAPSWASMPARERRTFSAQTSIVITPRPEGRSFLIRRPSRRLLPDSKPPRFQRREGRRNTRRARQASIRGDPPLCFSSSHEAPEGASWTLSCSPILQESFSRRASLSRGWRSDRRSPRALIPRVRNRRPPGLDDSPSPCIHIWNTPGMSSSHLQIPRPCRFCGTCTECWSAVLRSGFS